MSNSYLGDDDLIFNTSSRIPVCLCIDTSGSMDQYDDTDTSRIERVKKGVAQFYAELRENDLTKYSAEVAIVGFSTTPYIVQDFKTMDLVDAASVNLIPHGKGDLGKGVLKALELLQGRKESYKRNGIDYYQPWLIIMTDGRPTGEENTMADLRQAQQKVTEMETNKKLTVIPVFIGRTEGDSELSEIDSKADKYLSGFSQKNAPLQLSSGEKFSRFFEWLGKSVSIVTSDSDVELDFADLTDWDEI